MNRVLLLVWLVFQLCSEVVECEPRLNTMTGGGETMQITVERTGGFTGVAVTKIIDSQILSQQEAAQLHKMMTEADFFNLPSTISSSPQPDRFQYRITVEQESKQHSVTVDEAVMPANLKPLLNWLMAQPAQPATH
jgi:hypothetical protein